MFGKKRSIIVEDYQKKKKSQEAHEDTREAFEKALTFKWVTRGLVGYIIVRSVSETTKKMRGGDKQSSRISGEYCTV